MTTSVVEIWNHALARMGTARRVESELERSAEANLLRTQYPITLSRLLESYDWAFARVYGALTPINDDAELADGWSWAYEWPANALAIRAILNPAAVSDETPMPFEVAQAADGRRKILCMLEGATAKWTTMVDETHRFPPTFIHCLSLALQAEVAMSIARDRVQVQSALALFAQAESFARVSTSNQCLSRWNGNAHSPASIRARS